MRGGRHSAPAPLRFRKFAPAIEPRAERQESWSYNSSESSFEEKRSVSTESWR